MKLTKLVMHMQDVENIRIFIYSNVTLCRVMWLVLL